MIITIQLRILTNINLISYRTEHLNWLLHSRETERRLNYVLEENVQAWNCIHAFWKGNIKYQYSHLANQRTMKVEIADVITKIYGYTVLPFCHFFDFFSIKQTKLKPVKLFNYIYSTFNLNLFHVGVILTHLFSLI